MPEGATGQRRRRALARHPLVLVQTPLPLRLGLLARHPAAAAEQQRRGPWIVHPHGFGQHGDILSAPRERERRRGQGVAPRLRFSTRSSRCNPPTPRIHRDGASGNGSFEPSEPAPAGRHFWDGGVQRRVRRARAERKRAGGPGSHPRGLVYQVTSAYLELLRAQRAAIAERKLRKQRRRRRWSSSDQGGRCRGGEICPIEVQIANARVEDQGSNEVRVAGSALRNAMGIEPTACPRSPISQRRLPSSTLVCLKGSRAPAGARRAGGTHAAAGQADLAPQPEATVQRRAYLDRGFAAHSTQPVGLSATLSWVFDRADRAQVDAARADLRSAEEQERQVIRDLAAEVEQAHLAMTNTRERDRRRRGERGDGEQKPGGGRGHTSRVWPSRSRLSMPRSPSATRSCRRSARATTTCWPGRSLNGPSEPSSDARGESGRRNGQAPDAVSMILEALCSPYSHTEEKICEGNSSLS